jgi:hypothetical protein
MKMLYLLRIVKKPPTGHRYLHQNRFSPRLIAPTAGTDRISAPTASSGPAIAPLQIDPIGQKAHHTGVPSKAELARAEPSTAYLFIPLRTKALGPVGSEKSLVRAKKGVNFNFSRTVSKASMRVPIGHAQAQKALPIKIVMTTKPATPTIIDVVMNVKETFGFKICPEISWSTPKGSENAMPLPKNTVHTAPVVRNRNAARNPSWLAHRMLRILDAIPLVVRSFTA